MTLLPVCYGLRFWPLSCLSFVYVAFKIVARGFDQLKSDEERVGLAFGTGQAVCKVPSELKIKESLNESG